MNAQYRTLIERIKEEMKFVTLSVIRSEKAWEKAIINNDASFYDSVALNLHNMYDGTVRRI